MFIFEAINKNLSVWEVKEEIDQNILDLTAKKNEQNESAFIVACALKNLIWVDFLLSIGAEASEVNSSKQNAIMLLIDSDVPLINISALIELGVDLNLQDNTGQSSLFYSLNFKRPDLTHLLLSEGATPDILDQDGNSPLMLAALSGNPQSLELLLEAGAQIDVCNVRGQNALHMAAISGSLEVVKVLLAAKISVNVKDALGRSALHYACMQENSKVTDVLVKAGIDVNATDEEGLNAIMIAAQQGIPEQVSVLVKHGANLVDQDLMNESVVIKALKQGPIEVSHILGAEKIEAELIQKIAGATEDLSFMNEAIRVRGFVSTDNSPENILIKGSGFKENKSQNILVKARAIPSDDQYSQVAEILLNAGAPLDFKNEIGKKENLLNQIKKNQSLLKTLMVHEKRKTTEQPSSNTELTPNITTDKKAEQVEEGLSLDGLPDPKNITVNSRDAKGIPYLLIFASKGKHEVVEKMLNQGGDCKIRDKVGRTALMIASEFGHIETVKVILKYDKDVNFKTAQGCNALYFAILANKIEVASALLEAGANPDMRFKGGYLLHLVAENGRIELAKIMIKHGANPRVKDIKGRTPAQIANIKGFKELEGILGGPKEDV